MNRSFFGGVFVSGLLAVALFLALRKPAAGPSGDAVVAPGRETEILRKDVRRALAGDLTPSPRPAGGGSPPQAGPIDGPARPAGQRPAEAGAVPAKLLRKIELLKSKAEIAGKQGRDVSSVDRILRPNFDSFLAQRKFAEAEALLDQAIAFLDSEKGAPR